MAVQITRKRFTRDEYHKMAGAGILGEDDRVELVGGEIVQLTPIGKKHSSCLKRCNRFLGRALVGEDVIIGIQDPVEIGGDFEPQPDASILRSRADYYADALPAPEDVLIVMEVADTSVAYDRDVKFPLYAQAGIPEAWLWDLPSQIVERHGDPSERGYRSILRASAGESIKSLVLPSLTIRVDDILG